jgi:hypothetical protein
MRSVAIELNARQLFCLACLLALATPVAAVAADPVKGPSRATASKPAAGASAAPAPAKDTAAASPAPVDESPSKAEAADAAADDLLAADEAELDRQRAELDSRYAQVYRKIAELNLQTALDANKRLPNTVAPAEVDRLRQIVRLAEVQSKAADGGDPTSDQSLTIENDESQVKMTQEALRRTIAANNRAPGVVPRIELERLRLLAELGRLQLAKDKFAAEEKKAAGEMRKRFTQLEKQVKQLQETVDRLAQRSPAVPAQAASLAPVHSPAAKKSSKP